MSVLNRIPLILPDQILLDTVNQLLDIIKNDYNSAVTEGHESWSILNILLSGQFIGREDLYAAAIKIFVTTPQNPKKFDCKLSFDQNISNAPQLFLTQPSETPVHNSTSIGEGDQDELMISANAPIPDQYRAQYMRRYAATYNLVIVCENRTEMTIIYNVMKMLLVSCTNHFAMEGLSNLKIAGSELVFRTEIPDKLFRKAISLSFEYEQVVPSLAIQNIFRKIRIFWQPQGATTPSGPIEIDQDDDLDSSSS